MVDYARELYGMISGVGDAYQTGRGQRQNEISSNRDYAAALDQLGWKKQTDARDFSADQAYKNRYLDILQQKANEAGGGGNEFGLAPIWGTGPDGKPALIQLGKGGVPIQPQLPDGFQISRDPVRIDSGTGTVLLDPQTRQQIGFIPKDVAGEASANAAGKAQGEASAQLPAAAADAQRVNEQVQSLVNDPYLPSMVGPLDSWRPNISGDAARVQSKMDQLQGGAFLQARQMLKGGGAITDMEGRRAEAAFARLNAAQSESDYISALNEFNDAVNAGYAKLQAQAAGGGAPASPAAPATAPRGRFGPQPGTIEDGYRFRGGDPKNPGNWEPVQ